MWVENLERLSSVSENSIELVFSVTCYLLSFPSKSNKATFIVFGIEAFLFLKILPGIHFPQFFLLKKYFLILHYHFFHQQKLLNLLQQSINFFSCIIEE